MRHLLRRLRADDGGALIAAEFVLVATMLTLGAVSSLVAVRQALIAEVASAADVLLAYCQGPRPGGGGRPQAAKVEPSLADAGDSNVVTSPPPAGEGCDNQAGE
jgi:hypothetical protein